MSDYAFGSSEEDHAYMERCMQRDREELDIYAMLIETLQHLEKTSPHFNDFIPERTYMWWLGYKKEQRDEILRREAIKRLEADAARHGLKIEVK